MPHTIAQIRAEKRENEKRKAERDERVRRNRMVTDAWAKLGSYAAADVKAEKKSRTAFARRIVTLAGAIKTAGHAEIIDAIVPCDDIVEMGIEWLRLAMDGAGAAEIERQIAELIDADAFVAGRAIALLKGRAGELAENAMGRFVVSGKFAAPIAAAVAMKCRGGLSRGDGGGLPSSHDIKPAPGGYELDGVFEPLVGRPRDMLAALLASRWKRLDAAALVREMEIDDPDCPNDVLKHAAKALRKSLRNALKINGDPLPSSGSGKDLAYALKIDQI